MYAYFLGTKLWKVVHDEEWTMEPEPYFIDDVEEVNDNVFYTLRSESGALGDVIPACLIGVVYFLSEDTAKSAIEEYKQLIGGPNV